METEFHSPTGASVREVIDRAYRRTSEPRDTPTPLNTRPVAANHLHDTSLSSIGSSYVAGVSYKALCEKLRAEIALLQMEVLQLASLNAELRKKEHRENTGRTDTTNRNTHLRDAAVQANECRIFAAKSACSDPVVCAASPTLVPVLFHQCDSFPLGEPGVTEKIVHGLTDALGAIDGAATALIPSDSCCVGETMESASLHSGDHDALFTAAALRHLTKIIRTRAIEVRDAAVARQVAVAAVFERSLNERKSAADAYRANLEAATKLTAEAQEAQRAAEGALKEMQDAYESLRERNVELVRSLRLAEESRESALEDAHQTKEQLLAAQRELRALQDSQQVHVSAADDGATSPVPNMQIKLKHLPSTTGRCSRASESWPMPSPSDPLQPAIESYSTKSTASKEGNTTISSPEAAAVDALTRQILRRQHHLVSNH